MADSTLARFVDVPIGARFVFLSRPFNQLVKVAAGRYVYDPPRAADDVAEYADGAAYDYCGVLGDTYRTEGTLP